MSQHEEKEKSQSEIDKENRQKSIDSAIDKHGMKALSKYSYKELDSLTIEEKEELLQKEYDIVKNNRSARFELEEILEDENEQELINRILESILNAESPSEVLGEGEYPAKLAVAVLNHSEIGEDKFFEYIRLLYLNDYIDYSRFEEFNIDENSEDRLYDTNINMIDPTHQYRYNLHRLYKTNKELFAEGKFKGFEGLGSDLVIYYDILKQGSIIDTICSYESMIKLSNKGMHYLHFITSQKSAELIRKQEETLRLLNETTGKQEALLIEFEKYKEIHSKDIESIKQLINNHTGKINAFYKDITTILSILVAAFAVIGVNISAIPKIESNFTANVLVINLSVILCLLFFFYILRVIVYDLSINNKQFYVLLSIAVIGIIGVFVYLGFNGQNQTNSIESKVEKKSDTLFKKYTKENDIKIQTLEQQIKKLQK
ncbi:hypothetical protein ABE288_20590 [Bacillus salipaludis]|uniref:hypothetical protein n=1 Tax=Bacillus salipaludis TaxID=2547811 RepID=UPI003D1E42B3